MLRRAVLPMLLLAACGRASGPTQGLFADVETLPPLHRAAAKGDVALLTKLLATGDPAQKADHMWTPLHWAAIAGRADAVQVLLDRGADPNALGQFNLTPLHWAAMRARTGAVEVLLRHGARVDERTLFGMTALHLASGRRTAELLLDAGADVNAPDHYGMTPLHLSRGPAVAKLVLERGGNVTLFSRDSRSPMDMYVVTTGEPEGVVIYWQKRFLRLRRERAETALTVVNVAERTLDDVVLSMQSPAFEAVVKPERVRLQPGELCFFTVTLNRKPGVGEGEFPVDAKLTAGAKVLSVFDHKVDTSLALKPEDRGMYKVGSVTVRGAVSRWQYAAFAAVPVLLAGAWLVARWRKKRRLSAAGAAPALPGEQDREPPAERQGG